MTADLEADPLIEETVSRLCGDLCPPEVVNAAEDGVWPGELWDALESTGMSLAWVPESAGGAGATLADGFAVARTAARFALPVPVAETLCAGWLLGEAGLEAPAGPMAPAPVLPGESVSLDVDGCLRGTANAVPYAAHARHLAVVAAGSGGPVIALVPAASCEVGPGANLAGEARGPVRFDGARPIATGPMASPDPAEALLRMGATLRAQQIAGAMERILDQSLAYAGERSQFGRPIARFQAVQHNLASLAGEAAAAGAAAVAGAVAVIRHGIDEQRTLLAVATAKIRAGEAAGAGAAIAHQVHGAMGFTREYSLQQSTRRLWAWRDEFGAESVWATRLGEVVIAGGAKALWPALTSL